MIALAIDLGTKRAGLALGFSDTGIATPLAVVPCSAPGPFIEHLRKLTAGYEVERLVIGLPLNMDGSEGKKAAEARALAGEIGAALGLPVDLFDERLTTREAAERLRAAGKPARQARALVDMVAAQVLLEDYLRSRT